MLYKKIISHSIKKSKVLISFVGIDGSGKSTLMTLINDKFKEVGVSAVTLQTPRHWHREDDPRIAFMGGAARIFATLTNSVLPYAALMPFTQIYSKIKEKLEQSTVLLSDRHPQIDSFVFLRYQFGAIFNSIPPRHLLSLLESVNPKIKGLDREFIFMLDIPVVAAVARIKKRKGEIDPFENQADMVTMQRNFNQAIETLRLQGYEQLHIVSVHNRSPQDVADEVWRTIVRNYTIH